uniref:Fzo/mitofusin HR2 domain-containing protein n=1 Tax=Timema poppense TaxID=170557 RepID=A0A7R9DTX0_TIMPO|nr:unnamed protein product [Timema poppensis]
MVVEFTEKTSKILECVGRNLNPGPVVSPCNHRNIPTQLLSCSKLHICPNMLRFMRAPYTVTHERMTALIPPDKKHISLNIIPRREPFEILYRLNCDNLCADFHEDLEFRFSWGITSLINRFAGKQSSKLALRNYASRIPRDFLSPTENVDLSTVNYSSSKPSEDWSLWSSVALASIGSQGTMGGLLVAGFMLKTVGWRLILVTGAVYGCIYAYERLTWTNKAKERSFKHQYVAHATKKLRLIVDLTSANCSHQVQQ